MITESITWTPVASGLPDPDTTVNIALDETHDEPSWLGFHDGETWREVDGTAITGVLGWAPTLEGMR
jgi:hypothetical protein